MSPRKRIGPVTVLLVAFLINLPVAHSWWTARTLDNQGRQTTAEVTHLQAVPPKAAEQRYFVAYRLPETIDPREREHTGEVDRATYDAARATDQVAVTYLPDDPGENRPVGRADPGNLALGITVAADLALLAMLGLMLWARRTQDLVLIATADVVRCRPGESLQDLGGEEYVVRGDVLERSESEVVIAVEHQRIRVVLGEFTNPVGHQQPAEARGRRVSG